MIEVFAREQWYLNEPTPEELWKGVLRARPTRTTPAGRDLNTFVLLVENAEIVVYAPASQNCLARFQEQHVIVRGKVVDLSREGFGPELWIGAIGIEHPGATPNQPD